MLEDAPIEEPDVSVDGTSLCQPTNQLKIRNVLDVSLMLIWERRILLQPIFSPFLKWNKL